MVDIIVSVLVTFVSKPKPVEELRGLVYSETPRSDFTDGESKLAHWWLSPTKLAGVSLVMVIALNLIFR